MNHIPEASDNPIDAAFDVLKRYKVTKAHMEELHLLIITLKRFPYFKAIESALLDCDNETREYALNQSCVFKEAQSIPYEVFITKYKRPHNLFKITFDRLTARLRDVIPISPVYKFLSSEDINAEEHTDFSDAFIKQIKYRLIRAYFLPSYSHIYRYPTWAMDVNAPAIYYSSDGPIYLNKESLWIFYYIDKYLEEHQRLTIPFNEAFLYFCEIGIYNKQNKRHKGKFRELICQNTCNGLFYSDAGNLVLVHTPIEWPVDMSTIVLEYINR